MIASVLSTAIALQIFTYSLSFFESDSFPMSLELNLGILLGAAGLDYLLGDPQNWLHPVQVMGGFIQRLSDAILKATARSPLRRWAGVGLALAIILGSGATGWAIA